jgi:hypothetical protein
MSSNMVLEQEHATLSAQISKLQLSKTPVPEDLLDRKTGLEIRMNMLVTMVQLGSLTMSAYIENVKTAVADTKKMALAFKRGGKMELAKMALMRVKVMNDEVAEVEAAIASGDL